MSNDGIKWWPTIEVIKYDERSIAAITRDLGHAPSGAELRELERLGRICPDDITVSEGNALVSSGLDRITGLITGSGTGLTSATGFIGVGNSSAGVAAGQIALQGTGAGNCWYMGLDAVGGGPTRTTTTATNDTINVAATFNTNNSQFTWAEWCIGIATGTLTPAAALPGTSPIILNRKVDSLGSKGANSTWTLSASIKLA